MINQSIQNLRISDNFLSFYPALLFASQLLDVFRHFRESSFSLPSLAGQLKLYNRNTGDLVKMWLSASFIYVSRETEQHQVWCQLLQMSRVIVLTVYFYTFLFNLVFRCIPSPIHLLPSSQEQVCAYPLRWPWSCCQRPTKPWPFQPALLGSLLRLLDHRRHPLPGAQVCAGQLRRNNFRPDLPPCAAQDW